jgi:acylphosphatase
MFRKDYNPRELQFIPMMRLTAYISGRVQRVGFRAKAVALAAKMGLVGMVQNRPDGRVLVIAEGEKAELERFAEALRIENTYIHDSLDKQDQMLDKQDHMLDKQETTIEEISGQRNDLKTYMNMRFERIETDLAELKEMKMALKEKGFI